ncbi:MAG: Fur family transcriptional regulator [Lachnospirales bacterium]
MSKYRNSKQRKLVLDAVKLRKDHPTADQIYFDIHSKDGKISRSTVYRNLGILSENNEITHVELSEADRYDYRVDNHYHIICTECGKVIDCPIDYNENYDKELEKSTGFKIKRHNLIFEGICKECLNKNKD